MIEVYSIYILNISSDISRDQWPRSIFPEEFPWFSTLTRLLVVIHYTLVLTVIYQKFMKNGAFFFIFFYSGVLDVIHGTDLIFFYIYVDCIRGPDFVGAHYFINILDGILVLANIALNGLLLVNRFSATFLNYDQIWKMHKTRIYTLLCTVFALGITSPLFLRFRTFTIKNGAWVYAYDLYWNSWLRYMTTIVLGLYELLGIVLGLLTVHRLRTNIGTRSERFEKGLFTVTFVHMLLSLGFMSFQLVSIYDWTAPWAQFNKQYVKYGGLLLFVSSNSITIMVTNQTVRDEYWKLFRFRKPAPTRMTMNTITNVLPQPDKFETSSRKSTNSRSIN